MKKKFRLACYKFAPGCVRFINYRGYSQSHSRKIAREIQDENVIPIVWSDFQWENTSIDHNSGRITYNRKGGQTRYSLPPRQPRIFRGHK